MSMCRDTCMYSTSLGIRILNICFSLQIDPLPPPHTHCYHMIHAVIQVEIAKKKKKLFSSHYLFQIEGSANDRIGGFSLSLSRTHAPLSFLQKVIAFCFEQIKLLNSNVYLIS